MNHESAKAARELLAFYLEAGVESLVDEQPIDRLSDHGDAAMTEQPATTVSRGEQPRVERARSPAPRPASRATPPAPAQPVPMPPEEAAMVAREAARAAASLDELRAILDGFDGCPLKFMAKQLVFADGNPQARVMFVGEAPGRDEDLAGVPFVGRSGQLLDRMLAAIGMDRTGVYITNIIPWRPPGNRDPSLQETQICLPFIQRQIELVDPDVLVTLGRPSTAALIGVNDGIKRTRGRWFAYNTGKREIRALPTFHPAFLLRSPLEKRHAWRDMLAIKKALAG
jgi:uracil-DNA glycosylase